MTGVFANPAVVAQSWYPAMRGKAVPASALRPFDLGPRRLVVYRDKGGYVHAMDARCPHLGADLSQGRVEAEGIRCAFHGWTFAPNGRCVRAPGQDDRFDVSVDMRGRPQSRLWRLASGTRSRDIVARFTTIGGSLAWASVTSPLRFHVLFTARPDRDGGCVTQTIFVFRTHPGLEWVRAFGLMATLLHDDQRVLDTIDFRPAFSDADEPLRAYARVVNALGSW